MGIAQPGSAVSGQPMVLAKPAIGVTAGIGRFTTEQAGERRERGVVEFHGHAGADHCPSPGKADRSPCGA